MQVDIRYQVSPYILFFIIYSSQVGVGILGFQRSIAKEAGYDAWISVLLAGCVAQVLIWIMYKLVSKANGDIVAIQKNIFGKYLGGFINVLFMIYYGLASISVLRSYIEIVQVWMFPTLPTWCLAIIIMTLSYYIISGGFRIVAGICFISVILPIVTLVSLNYFPLRYAHIDNLLPIMNHSLSDILNGIKASIYTIAGFEILLMVYPFINKRKSPQKFAHLAILATTLLYTLSAIIAFLFYSEKQLSVTIWPEFSMTKVIHFSFLERFEYIYISFYMLTITSLISLLLWASSRGFKLIFRTKQKYPLLILCLIDVVFCQLLSDRSLIIKYLNLVSQINFWMFYVYIPLLFILYLILKRGQVNSEI
ncbi:MULTISPECIES: GerAB/ArcD/ProY family transporter [unclassified Bacillus (in: firmicutes)]|uniref:GerAB/ArcD/ProY family transporter n=1 Tax=unclassified Bacillus (in: firmicutes) TaxID=185979 RepID=UPI0008E18EFE|nr:MULTISPECIES: GerAB/ArcD/ProY family transporter [unclassified Bacillus (in: firmicutes)]SFA85952.1 spore germination protein (amino acid permease) [Bacillus sp. UNCCL13]SFQ83552.1 spore germination protein (amino acid permease) [Bacillus sp. cl95]